MKFAELKLLMLNRIYLFIPRVLQIQDKASHPKAFQRVKHEFLEFKWQEFEKNLLSDPHA